MDQERSAKVGQHRHRFAQVVFIDGGELLDAARNEEALESKHTRLEKGREFGGVARHHAAPEIHCHPTFSKRGAAFRLQRFHGRRRWNAIQRHIDDCCYAAHRGRLGSGGKASPISTPWIVDVDVRVDLSSHQHGALAIDDALAAELRVVVGSYVGNYAVFYEDRRGSDAAGQDHARSTEDEVGVHEVSWRSASSKRLSATLRRYIAVERMSSIGAISVASIFRAATIVSASTARPVRNTSVAVARTTVGAMLPRPMRISAMRPASTRARCA